MRSKLIQYLNERNETHMWSIDQHNDIKINDEVFFFPHEMLPYEKGIVTEINTDGNYVIFNIKWKENHYNSAVQSDHVFKTEDAIKEYHEKQLTDTRARYNNMIDTIDDLFEFCIDEMKRCEDPDYIAIEVAEEKFKEIKQQISEKDEKIKKLKTRLNLVHSTGYFGINPMQPAQVATIAGNVTADVNGVKRLDEYALSLSHRLTRARSYINKLVEVMRSNADDAEEFLDNKIYD